jgi:sugar lactone lactonase YvrE
VVDAERGWLYVSDSHDPEQAGPGVWRFDLSTGAGGLWYAGPLRFANGMALSLDRTELLVAETFARRISAIPIGPDEQPGDLRVVADELPGLPDGIALDRGGVIYVGCYEPSRLLRLEPGGEPEVLIEDETAHLLCHPTNLAFRGRELFTSNLGRWHITRLELDSIGAALL